jgi:CCR4-NOT transcription complex subunit 2
MEELTDYNSEFPSLSNNPQHNQGSQSTMWSTGGRNLGAPNMPPRNQGTPNPPQASQRPDDMFNGTSRMSSAQGSFRFGNQANQNSQAQRSSVDDFPPLNRNANGDIGQERGTNMMSNFGFGAAGAASSSSAQPSGAGNGLLNALSANSRSTDVRSPTIGKSSPNLQSTDDL